MTVLVSHIRVDVLPRALGRIYRTLGDNGNVFDATACWCVRACMCGRVDNVKPQIVCFLLNLK